MIRKKNNPKAVVLLSGGLDSATTAAIAMEQGFGVHGLTIDYGQRHAIETDAARRLGKALNLVAHIFQSVDLRAFGASALTDSIPVPKSTRGDAIQAGIPVTYVPARNTIFLSLALGYAEAIGATDIFIGVNAVDYSGYPDCRPAFIEAFERLANLATRDGVEGDGESLRIHAPLIHRTKAQIIREGVRLGVDFSLTHSCYDPAPDGLACGLCDACWLRKKGFAEAGVVDPIPYSPEASG